MINNTEVLNSCFNAIEDKKGENIIKFNISKISIIADYMIIASGNNKNQVQAIADNVLEKLHSNGIIQNSIEGYDSANWILIDIGDIIIHIFDKESREFFNLERLYKDAEYI